MNVGRLYKFGTEHLVHSATRARLNHMPNAKLLPFVLLLVVAACGGSSSPAVEQKQADCDKIAANIAAHGGRPGVCNSTVKADVEHFGSACAALRACEDAVDFLHGEQK